MPDVFFALSLMMLPRLSMGDLFLLGAEFASEAYVACKRMDAFLKIAEPPLPGLVSKSGGNGSVHVCDGNYGWYGQEDEKKPEDKQSCLQQTLTNVCFISVHWDSFVRVTDEEGES